MLNFLPDIMPAAQIVSIIGTVFFLGSFAALNFGILESTSWIYQAANFLGASCFTYVALSPFNSGLFITEFAWACFGVFGLWKIYQATSKKGKTGAGSATEPEGAPEPPAGAGLKG